MLTKENAANELLKFRSENKKTQEQISEKTGISVQTLSGIESGKIKTPQTMTIFKLNEYFNRIGKK